MVEMSKKRIFNLFFLEVKICSGFCSKIDEDDDVECKELCRSLISDAGRIDEICPFEKNCPRGCPCSYYECDHIDTRKLNFAWYFNATDDLFQFKNDTKTITVRDPFADPFKTSDDPYEEEIQHLSRLVSLNITSRQNKRIYERFIYEERTFREPHIGSLLHPPVN